MISTFYFLTIGTGKTTLIGFLAQLVGITLITDLIPASSLRRSYVGETDHILIQFGMRAAYQPWRLCVLSLDEIETLVKKRPENAEKASDSSVNTLLALISGGSNVPTLHILGSTNMGNSIDAALLRRLLDGFFFVGLMNVQARTAMIEARVLESFYSWRINALDPSKESTKKKLYFVNDMVKDYFIAITMNLGGSHLQAILNRMLSTAEELHRLGFQNQSGEAFGITKQLCFENTRHVCAKQSLFLGDSYLCDYFRHNVSTVGADLMSSLPKRVAKLGIPDVLNLSGRILVNLRDSDTKDIAFDYLTPRFMFMEANYHGEPLRMNSNKNEMQPHQHRILQRIDCTIKNSSRPAMIQDIIVMCTKFCVNNDVDVLKVFGGAWLKQHSLSKEDEAMTKLSQEVFDCKEYKSVMFVFDIDSLIVSEYKPQDNDYANGNIEQIALWKGLLYQVLEIARTANVYVPPVAKGSENALDNDDETKEDHDRKAFIEKLRNESTDRSTGWQFSTSEKPQTRWVVFVTQNPSSLAAFQRAVRFPRTAEESINIANNEMMNEEKRCTVCDQLFCWAENEGGCRWHVPEAIIEFVDINKVPIGNLDTRRKAIAALSRLSAPEIQKGIWSCCKSSCTTFECSMRDAKHVRVSSNESDMKNVLSLEQEKEAIELCYPNIRLLDIVEQMEGASQSSSYRTTSDNRYEAGAGSFRPTHSFGFSNSEFEMDYEG